MVLAGGAVAVEGDTATYYWNADKASGDWNDPACWTSSVADSDHQYPDSSGCFVSFKNAPANVTVHVNGTYTAKQLKLEQTGIDLTLKGDGYETSKLVANGQVSNSNNATVTLDGLSVEFGRFSHSAGQTLRLVNGAHWKSSQELTMTNPDILLELRGESYFFQEDWCIRMSGRNARIIIDDSTLTTSSSRGNQDLDLAYTASSANGTNRVEFVGTHPRLLTGQYGVRSGSDAVGCEPEYVFHVPVGGYAEAPVQRVNTIGGQLKYAGLGKNSAVYAIAPDSPCFAVQGKVNCPLLAWRYTIDTAWLKLSPPARNGAAFAYTYGWVNNATTDRTEPEAEELPTGLSFVFRPQGLLVLVR